MDRFDVIRFDDLTGPKGGEWTRIGGGSFGVVFRGEYLGTEVAIKEVLPNNTYDVEKYFERECVLMKEARHPNIVQYIGLTKGPGQDGRIYIVSEFVGPNLRQHIADRNKPLGWPLRMSFATDIARAVAYLHARNCMHRDLKGENLLITDNNRIKVCDFGFARIAARSEEEMRRISYCGTDGYMSPEILLGVDFSLPSDVFSLGIIFCEIISRHLVDPNTFKRQMPSFGLDEDEVREMASEGCPTDFINLCLEMTRVEPDERPDMRHVIRRLRAIEQEVIQKEYSKGTMSNIGSVRSSGLSGMLGSKANSKTGNSRRLPSFDGKVTASQLRNKTIPDAINEAGHERNASDSSDEDVEEALRALEQFNLGNPLGAPGVAESIRAASTFKAAGHGNPWWDDSSDSSSMSDIAASWLRQQPPSSTTKPWRVGEDKAGDNTTHTSTIKTAMPKHRKAEDEYSTSIVRPSRKVQHPSLASSLSKMTGSTVKVQAASSEALDDVSVAMSTVRSRPPLGMMLANGSISRTIHREASDAETLKALEGDGTGEIEGDAEVEDVTQSYMTARSHRHQHDKCHNARDHEPSFAMATIASSIFDRNVLYHRFTLVKNGVRKTGDASSSTVSLSSNKMPYQLILANALTKCNVCFKRLGFNAYMDCDDCPYKTHIACADMAEPNCHEMHIPGSHSPSSAGSPALNSPKWLATPIRRGSEDERREGEIGEKENEAMVRTATPIVRVGSPKVSPSSLSKGVAMFRKRNSKSPPPNRNGTSPVSAVRAHN